MTNDVGTSNGGKATRKVGCIPDLAEVRSAEENWTGLTDPAIRRKLQNRLNQRIYQMDWVTDLALGT
ncbi:putative S-adenosylmethionine-dependent methyltransferase CRG1 [Penicillium verhagenii]|uniref:putative S-adenosylmethionine-dependent methyltransferase CRG1 n=1 Tax=Penicillium verhagenii TaxID=1562060 RepID=UPI0025458A99|nr:putative S-adenosylmethionine-dependent methyltransferase CRG1 [Penicillium verhagenii]KAJ5948008.1 putative S-adenosylmethionine-dependent methyltransferase CRG1 [Penicillium verhagenii]